MAGTNTKLANVQWYRYATQGSNPASPAAGFHYHWWKTGGFYFNDENGIVTGPVYGAQATEEKTIATGAITLTTGRYHYTVDTQGDASSDDLDTITGLVAGMSIYLVPEHTDRTIVIKHGTGNLYTLSGSDITLDTTKKGVEIHSFNGTDGIVMTSAGAAGVTDHGALTGLADDDHTQYILNVPASSARNLIQPTDDYHGLEIRANAAQSSEALFVLSTSAGAPILEMSHEGALSGNLQQNASGNLTWDGANVSNLLRVRASTDAVGVGVGIPTAALHVDQTKTDGARPVLKLDQADVSEEFIHFIGESTTDATQSLVDAADMTTPGSIAGWVRIYINDVQTTNPITDGIYFVPFYTTPTA